MPRTKAQKRALRQTLQDVKDAVLKAQWNQDQWVNECGTAGCFAGWRGIRDAAAGAVTMVSQFPDERRGRPNYVQLPDRKIHVARYAQEKFGLSEAECDVLFNTDNSLSRLEMLVEMLCDDKDITYMRTQAGLMQSLPRG